MPPGSASTVTGYSTHGLPWLPALGPSLERSVDHKPKWVLHSRQPEGLDLLPQCGAQA